MSIHLVLVLKGCVVQGFYLHGIWTWSGFSIIMVFAITLLNFGQKIEGGNHTKILHECFVTCALNSFINSVYLYISTKKYITVSP